MPRESFDIKDFGAGLVTAYDSEDIPTDAASYEENVDGELDDGHLVGRKDDSVISTTYGLAAKSSAQIIEDSGKVDLLYQDGFHNTVSIVRDFGGGSPAKTDLLSGVDSNKDLSFTVNNREAHIGMGNGSADKPKWAGYLSSKFFGQEPSPDPVLVDAEVVGPQAFPFLYKTITDGTYLYGFGFQGDTVYKIKISDGSITLSPANTFVRLTAMIEEDATYFWVFDAGASTNGTVKRVKKADLTTDFITTCNAFTGAPAGFYITDMQTTTNLLWFAFYHPDPMSVIGTSSPEKLLFTIPKPAANGTATPTNRSPKLVSTGTGAGNFFSINLSGTVAATAFPQELFPLSLIKLDATHVGWAMRVRQPAIPGFQTVLYMDNGLAHTAVSGIIHEIPESQTAGAIVSLILFDNRTTQLLYTGFLYDGTNLFTSHDSHAYKIAVAANYTAGHVSDASSPSALATTYNEAVVYTTGGEVFLTRVAGTPGVDKIDAGFTTVTEVLGGGSVSLTVTDSTTDDVFQEHTTYYYKVCLVYDGYQYSPLSQASFSKTNGAAVTKGAHIVINVASMGVLNPRTSAIVVFKATSGDTSTQPETFFRVVDTVQLDDPRWVKAGISASLTFDDNEEKVGASYESQTGIPETLISTGVNYSLAASLNGQQFVGNCYKSDLPDASHMIFRSKTGRLDTFDWSTDFLRLPVIPTALAAFAGRLWVFSNNFLFRVNPQGLYVEDTYEGVGAFNQHSVVVTDQGMFWGDAHNVYWHNGQNFQPIGAAIRTSSGTNAQTINWVDTVANGLNYRPIAGYFKRKGYLVFLVSGAIAGSWTDGILAYHIMNKRWDFWTLPTSLNGSDLYAGMFSGQNGTLYVSYSDNLYSICASSTNLQCTWISKDFSADDPSQKKKYYKVKVGAVGTAVPTLYHIDDYTGTATAITLVSNVGTFTPPLRQRSFRLKVVYTSTDTSKIKNIAVLYRRMAGKR